MRSLLIPQVANSIRNEVPEADIETINLAVVEAIGEMQDAQERGDEEFNIRSATLKIVRSTISTQ